MPKQKQPDDKLSMDEAERARDLVLRRMLTTPPKTHAGIEKPGPVPRKRKKLKLLKQRED